MCNPKHRMATAEGPGKTVRSTSIAVLPPRRRVLKSRRIPPVRALKTWPDCSRQRRKIGSSNGFLIPGRNGARTTAKSAAQTEPFEIAVVITDNNQAFVRNRAAETPHLDVAIEIFRSEPRAPHQIEHGLSEMLIRFANNASFFCSRIFLAEGAIEIGQGNAPAIAIQERSEAPNIFASATTTGRGKRGTRPAAISRPMCSRR